LTPAAFHGTTPNKKSHKSLRWLQR